MTDPEDNRQHVWSDEEGDYYVAASRDELVELVDPSLEGVNFVALPDDYNLTLEVGGEDDDDGLTEGVTRTCAEWAASKGRGRLGSGRHFV